jgi:hypothetical protein
MNTKHVRTPYLPSYSVGIGDIIAKLLQIMLTLPAQVLIFSLVASTYASCA